MMEVKVFKQKVKHLLYEQENSIAEIKAENMVALKVISKYQGILRVRQSTMMIPNVNDLVEGSKVFKPTNKKT